MAGRLSKSGRAERRPRWFPVGDVVASGWSKDGLFGVPALGRGGRGRAGEMKHSFTRALTARKVDFMMIITGEGSKSGWRSLVARPASLYNHGSANARLSDTRILPHVSA